MTAKAIYPNDLQDFLKERSDHTFTISEDDQGRHTIIATPPVRHELTDAVIESREDAVAAIARFLASDEGIHEAMRSDLSDVAAFAEVHGVPFDAELTEQLIRNRETRSDDSGDETFSWKSSSTCEY